MPVFTLMTCGAEEGCTSSASVALIFVSFVILSTVAVLIESGGVVEASPMLMRR